MMPRSMAALINRIQVGLGDARTARHAALVAGRCGPAGFDFDAFSARVVGFILGMRTDDSGVRYRYSAACRVPTLYASAYACMTLSLLGRLGGIPAAQRQDWLAYFDSFQRAGDGLFVDPAVENTLFEDSDWWGARHLAVHLASAYTDLGGRPRHPFRFLAPFCDANRMQEWLGTQPWHSAAIGRGDIDNKIMNVGCLLQYQRDRWADAAAGEAVDCLKKYLVEKINPATGLWGGFDADDPEQRSRMVQFAYHLLCLFFHDGDPALDCEGIARLVLRTQNRLGGWGVRLNSSACEDIDSIDILIRLAPRVPALRTEIEAALARSSRWVLANQVADGGFVFRLFEPFVYGHEATSSASGEGGMLPTWFRTLSLAYLTRQLAIRNGFVITPCPGYEF